MKPIIERNYASIKKRGKITPHTSHVDFYHKLNEELQEVKNEISQPIDLDRLGFELADVCLVCFNWMHHYGLNPEKFIKEKIVINEKRND